MGADSQGMESVQQQDQARGLPGIWMRQAGI